MKKFISIIFLTVNIAIYSQPVLNSSDFVNGISSYGYYLNFPAFSPGSAGENQTWDYSTLPFDNNGFTLTSVPFSSSPYSSNFPEGNFSLQQSYTSVINYQYYKLTPSSIEAVGSVEDNVPLSYYQDFKKDFEFPFTYGYEYTDTYQKTTNSSIETQIVSYDAYGTLILPTGTYTNVIRKKTITQGVLNPSYSWFQVNPFRMLLAGGVGSMENVIVYQTINLGLNQNNINSKFKIYPNPTNGVFAIENFNDSANELTISIYDFSGRIVLLTRDFKNIDISSFDTGLYLIKITDLNNQILYTNKLIKN